MRTLPILLLLLLLLAALAAPVAGQEREIRDANLPRALETRLLRMYGGGAERIDGEATVAAGETRRGDLAVMGGPLRVAGRLEGDAAVVGGDLVLEPGAEVTGSITVVGGQVRMADDAVVGGTITAYGPATSRWRPARDDEEDPDVEWRPRRWSGRGDDGYARLTVRTGVSYNRVEGLPIMFGPALETAGPAPLRLEALAIWRTESGAVLGAEEMGYQVRAEQFLSRDRTVSLGASVHSVVEPMDRWQVRDLEASLGSFLFHQDLRDHFDRTGWSAFARVRPAAGLELRATYRDERHGVLAAGDPWAVFNRSQEWRLQPLVAEGTLRSVGASAELDRRDRRRDPRRGWLARASVERPVGGALTRPELLVPTHIGWGSPVAAEAIDTDFTTAFLDLRTYSPVGHRSQLNLRAVGGGSVSEQPLPPQHQHALGGPGTLPGYRLFHGDCGARSVLGVHEGQPFYAGYGCDRFVLGQAEYRGTLSLDFGWGDWGHGYRRDGWHGFDVHARPVWVLFANAGRGWAYGALPGTAEDGGVRSTGTLVDAGVGVLVGRLGVYGAVPLRGAVEQRPRFTLRWGPRL
jgi:hypothetical protein